MSKQREALHIALEALEKYGTSSLNNEDAYSAAIKTIREALAEPEPEPVGIVRTVGGYPDDSKHTVEWLVKHKDLHDGDKLYAAPPARKPLTDEDISAIVQSMSSYTWDAHMLARAIERAHGITND